LWINTLSDPEGKHVNFDIGDKPTNEIWINLQRTWQSHTKDKKKKKRRKPMMANVKKPNY
jgi:plasmid maintenance system antidote protein VapI